MGFVSQGNPTIYRGDFIAMYAAFKRTYSTGTSVAIWTRVHKATVSVAEKRKKQNITAVLGYLINKKTTNRKQQAFKTSDYAVGLQVDV